MRERRMRLRLLHGSGKLPRRSAWLAPHSTVSLETVEASRSTWRLPRHGNEGIDTPAGAENH